MSALHIPSALQHGNIDWLLKEYLPASTYDYIFGPEGPDPRVVDYPLVDPYSPVVLSLIYLSIVAIGPRLMRDRKAFNMKPVSRLSLSLLPLLST